MIPICFGSSVDAVLFREDLFEEFQYTGGSGSISGESIPSFATGQASVIEYKHEIWLSSGMRRSVGIPH